MINNKLFTNKEEIKKILSITDTSQDVLIDYTIQNITNALNRELGVSELLEHNVEKEPVKGAYNGLYYLTKDFPVLFDKDIKLYTELEHELTQYTYYSHPNEHRTIRVKHSSGTPTFTGYDKLLISYTAGFSSKNKIKIESNPTDTQTLTLLEYKTQKTYIFKDTPTEDNHIQIGANITETSENISLKIEGEAVGDTVTLPFGFEYFSSTVSIIETKKTIPQDFIFLMVLLIGGAVQETGRATNSEVSEYNIGDKRVKYIDLGKTSFAVSEKNENVTTKIIKKWGSGFKKFNFLC